MDMHLGSGRFSWVSGSTALFDDVLLRKGDVRSGCHEQLKVLDLVTTSSVQAQMVASGERSATRALEWTVALG